MYGKTQVVYGILRGASGRGEAHGEAVQDLQIKAVNGDAMLACCPYTGRQFLPYRTFICKCDMVKHHPAEGQTLQSGGICKCHMAGACQTIVEKRGFYDILAEIKSKRRHSAVSFF